ncbi:MAG TPA: hypothetical protein VNT30_20035 [Stellaceae bacterium]|nr:hypothetical protein [Stellaceae bacterium]
MEAQTQEIAPVINALPLNWRLLQDAMAEIEALDRDERTAALRSFAQGAGAVAAMIGGMSEQAAVSRALVAASGEDFKTAHRELAALTAGV